jgi:hypothetical protein
VNKETGRKYFWVRWLSAILITTFGILIGGIEYIHYHDYGHFVSYGLHADALNRDADIGIPGQTKMYWPRLSNYTLWPVKLAACDYITDAIEPGTEYPYAVQRWNTSSNAWETIAEVNGDGYCHPYPLGMIETNLVYKRLWPGVSVDVMEGEATGAREPFQKGDRARFIVFTTANKNDAWKTAIPSAPFVIQDQVIHGNVPSRVRH